MTEQHAARLLWIWTVVLVSACSQTSAPRRTLDPSLGSQLLAAVNDGKTDVALGLLSRGADPNAVKERKQTVLMTAATVGDPFIASALLKAGADPNAQNEGGITALMAATTVNKPDVVTLLLKGKARTDLRNADGLTALHIAAAIGTDTIAAMLVAAGANVDDRRPKDGVTPLLVAAGAGQAGVVKVLLQAGAKLDGTTTDGKSATTLARVNGHQHVVDLLERARTQGVDKALLSSKDEALAADVTLFSEEFSKRLVAALGRADGGMSFVPESARPSIQTVLAKYGDPDAVERRALTLKFSQDGEPIPATYQIYRFGRLELAVPVSRNPEQRVEYVFVTRLGGPE